MGYGYDDLYRLTSETISGAISQNGSINYTYDAVGNRTQLTSTVPIIPSSGLMNYNANDQLATDAYDSNGNTVVNASTTNVYDFENHLVQHGAVTIAYDADGNRVSETVGGVTTQYLVDTANPTGYAQVVDELQGGSVTRRYTWGLELISQSQVSTQQTTTSFYGFDGHGSVRFLTNSTGAITDTYDYDAFGNLLSSTGNTSNNYLFAGEQFDPNLGLYYNRARYLDVRSGRFLSMDTWGGDDLEPVSLHKYLYASGNPASRIDPSGNASLAEEEEETVDNGILEAALQGIVRATRVLQLVRTARTIALGIVVLAVAFEVGDDSEPATSQQPEQQPDRGPIVDEKNRRKKPQMLYRLGKDWEFADALEEQSETAADVGFPHGVSALSKLPPKHVNNTGWAFFDDVTAYFPVKKTGSNPFHYTVVLPHPVTEPTADRFNIIFHRIKPLF